MDLEGLWQAAWDKTKGKKTYAVGVLAIGLGLYFLANGREDLGLQTLVAGLALFGIRHAITTERKK